MQVAPAASCRADLPGFDDGLVGVFTANVQFAAHVGYCRLGMLKRLRDAFCATIQNFVKIGQTVAEISRFLFFFHDGGRRHLGFSKIQNFNG